MTVKQNINQNLETMEDLIKKYRNKQQEEVKNNFTNGNLWDELEDKIYNLKKYGQENYPLQLPNNAGYKLNNGDIVYYGTFEDLGNPCHY
tara:strand:+ start:110 stop:379 length:270 start_codon:yes stop_codon:yes gene_type:complete